MVYEMPTPLFPSGIPVEASTEKVMSDPNDTLPDAVQKFIEEAPQFYRTFYNTAPRAELPAPQVEAPRTLTQYVETHDETLVRRPQLPAELAILAQLDVLMPMAQRLLLWSLTYGLAPRRYLEIGTQAGGSAMIVLSAIRALGQENAFRGVCIDPAFELSASTRETLSERFGFLACKNSPEAMVEAGRQAQGLFDLIYIDGDHHYDYVLGDILLSLPYLAPGGQMLVDDAANAQVRDAIRYALSVTTLSDGGWLCRHATGMTRMTQVESGPWQGQRPLESGCYLLHKPA